MKNRRYCFLIFGFGLAILFVAAVSSEQLRNFYINSLLKIKYSNCFDYYFCYEIMHKNRAEKYEEEHNPSFVTMSLELLNSPLCVGEDPIFKIVFKNTGIKTIILPDLNSEVIQYLFFSLSIKRGPYERVGGTAGSSGPFDRISIPTNSSYIVVLKSFGHDTPNDNNRIRHKINIDRPGNYRAVCKLLPIRKTDGFISVVSNTIYFRVKKSNTNKPAITRECLFKRLLLFLAYWGVLHI